MDDTTQPWFSCNYEILELPSKVYINKYEENFSSQN